MDDFEIFEGDNRLSVEAVRRILPQDGMQAFVSLVLDLSVSTRNQLDEMIAGATSFVRLLKEERGLSVQIGIEVFAGDRLLTRWQAPNLKADILIDRLAAIGDFAPDFENSTNLNGAIIQGLDRLAADTDSFRRRNRGGAFTTEYLVVFTDGADTAGFERTDAVLERIAVSSAEVTVVGLDSPDFDADALQALATDGLLIAPDAASLRREFEAIAARISGQMQRAYLLAYCTPKQAGEHTVTVRVAEAENRGTAQFRFTAGDIAAPGCGEALFDGQCANKQCGGLGCGFCDDRIAGCQANDQCQSYCDTNPPTLAVPVAERCDHPNPNGYVQFCEQDISTRCDGLCTDLANDPAHCGGCESIADPM